MDGKLNESISKDKKWTVRRLRRRARSSRAGKSKITAKEKLHSEEKEKDTCEKENAEPDLPSDNTSKVNVIGENSLLAECGLLPQNRLSGNASERDIIETPKTSVKNENVVNAEKMLFGYSLGKHHVSNIELDSDQESTDGEEESVLAAEVPDRLTPDWLLW